MISDNTITQSIKRHTHQELEISETISSGGFASVHIAKWRGTSTTFAIKKFRNSSKNDIINEIYLMGKVIYHPNIITICGVTMLEGETNYSLVLEYADNGTLGKYLKDNATTFEWEDQIRFANEITSAILCLHENEIIHGDLHSSNILVHRHTIKLADFGYSRLHGSVIDKKEKACGVVPYMDPKVLNDPSCDLTKESDIYSLAVIFWQLTSCKPPFESETEVDLDILKIRIINGKREISIPNTNDEYVKLYQKCWEFKPDNRPNISEIVDILKSISPEKNYKTINSEEGETTKKSENENQSCQI